MTSLIALVILFLVLIFYAIGRRIIFKQREKKFQTAEDRVLPILFEYLSGEKSQNKVEAILQTHFEIVAAFRNINLMIDNMEGKDRIALKKLLDLSVFKNYYLKQINSRYPPEIAQACIYFEKKNITDNKMIEKLIEIQQNEQTILSYSATLALINSVIQHIRDAALDVYLKRENNASMAVNDIIYKYASSHADQNTAAEKLFSYVDHDEVPPKTSAHIIQMLPELGYVQLSDKLFELFKNRPKYDEEGMVKAALIDVLHEFSVQKVSAELIDKETWKSEHKRVKLATARWIEDNYDSDMNYLLLNLVNDSDLEIRISAQKALTQSPTFNKLEPMISPKYREEWTDIKKSVGK